ncbi:MAG: TylF/MycF/NovP-related O-methyltransferase [Candidatus Ozemobacteraceae bacterium]
MKRVNLFRWIREFIEVQKMPSGYYMEFGVLNGECMIDAFRQLRGTITHCFGFDSFEGLPELSLQDQNSACYSPVFIKGNFASTGYDFVQTTILGSCRMGADELTLVKGFFSDVLPVFDKNELKKYGVPLVIYIDCDLYSSTVDVLHFIDDLVVPGTWLLFDDYWFFRGSPMHGQQKAIREWLENNPRIGISAYDNFEGWGRAFIVYEK